MQAALAARESEAAELRTALGGRDALADALEGGLKQMKQQARARSRAPACGGLRGSAAQPCGGQSGITG